VIVVSGASHPAGASAAARRYVAFLRGINVGGHAKIAMADLRAMLNDLGYEDVATLLQSGNAVLTADGGPTDVATAIEDRLRTDTGLDVRCVVRTADELRNVLAHDPYGGHATDPAKYVVGFMDKAPAKAKVAAIDPAAYAPDEFRVVGREAYIWCPSGLANTKLTGATLEKKLGVAMTARNWNTCQKVLALADT
jgi:uncharacterized protein (DUF1697 family)